MKEFQVYIPKNNFKNVLKLVNKNALVNLAKLEEDTKKRKGIHQNRKQTREVAR